ncbi:MAG: sugar ABC transporter ATP-binding protein [Rhizobiales bacterium]|nr:sugar ABC transporter ATP-binding protein [Hyphomicrobiales bacterium]
MNNTAEIGPGASAATRVPGHWIEIRGLAKHFAGEVALDHVDLDIMRGEVHGLVGANGAGKSTLIRCLAGVTVADAGRITIGGEEYRQGSPQAAEKAGLAFIHQELNLVPHFSALENMLLGAPKAKRLGLIDWKRSGAGARAAAEKVGIRFPLETKVSELGIGERWLVMIGKALARDASMIAMDEPTASLSAAETEHLFALIRELARSGVAILYVSHRLDEVLDLSDRITVLRDGEIVGRTLRGSLDKKGLIRAIVGHDVQTREDRKRADVARSGLPLFSARNVARGSAVKDVSFDLWRGEILGLGGLIGAGRTETARLAFGVDRLEAGHFELEGERLAIRGESDAIARGIALVPEERRSQGLMLDQSVAFNITIAALKPLRSIAGLPIVSSGKVRAEAGRMVRRLSIKTPGVGARISGLSGGNQQKALIARWLGHGMKVLIVDEPSRGVDIGAREEIHDAIRDLARAGVGIIVISSDVEELALVADRVVVLHEGRVTGELTGDDITEARIVELSYLDRGELGGEGT